MKWQILNKINQNPKVEEILRALLENRGLKTSEEIWEFLHPVSPEKLTARDLGINEKELQKAIIRLRKAVDEGEEIIVWGDYDADGICATAIVWESLYKLTKKVLPYIPDRVSEGYGLNKEAILKLKAEKPKLGLIITVDNGITASEKIKFAAQQGIEVIVCDHHQLQEKAPECAAVVHTDKVCAAAIAWLVARELLANYGLSTKADYLDLVAIASISDLEPLLGVNRSLVKSGLEVLNQTRRCGLQAIMEEAGLTLGQIGTYEVGYLIAPRLNAMGRMEHALESLRLVCTTKTEKAKELAKKLGSTNRERQNLTEETTRHAIENSKLTVQSSKLVFVAHESYNEGIIGLVAGKLVEEFYRPAIVVSLGETYSKASARSINGFNIIEAIRAHSDLLIDAGGHPMAAGFTIETTKIELLKQRLLAEAEKQLSEEALQKTLKIDLELPLSVISMALWEALAKMAPFGLGNAEPVFKARVKVDDFKIVGSTGKHLKLTLSRLQTTDNQLPVAFSAIAFNQGALANKLRLGQEVEVAYSLSLNEWKGAQSLELKIRDLKIPLHGLESQENLNF